jgi:beta-fructofuranosidase
VLYHWEGRDLAHLPWEPTGEYFRAMRDAGESLRDTRSEEWLQSPFIICERGTYYMVYGGHGTGCDEAGNPVPREDRRVACQICVMISPDGRSWRRRRDARGYSRLFVGPGEARDPCVLRVGNQWIMYYAGYHDADPACAGFYARTSSDLFDWSDWRLVHLDGRYGSGRWDTECPHVVRRGGEFYLFRTEDYASARTHVFSSDDPFDFGIGDARPNYVGAIAVAAPEVVVDSAGREFITSNHDLRRGTMVAPLVWRPA